MTQPNDIARSDRQRDRDHRLLRLLLDPEGARGEMSPQEAQELRARLDDDPVLAARYARLRDTWAALAPPPDALPPGFRQRVMARVTDRAVLERGVSLVAAPLWVRAAATVALAVGLATGLFVGRLHEADPATSAPVEIVALLDSAGLEESPTLAESYLTALAQDLEPGEETIR